MTTSITALLGLDYKYACNAGTSYASRCEIGDVVYIDQHARLCFCDGDCEAIFVGSARSRDDFYSNQCVVINHAVYAAISRKSGQKSIVE